MAPISLKKGYIDELAGDLVKHYLYVSKYDDNFQIGVEYVMTNLRFHRFLDVNPREVSRSLGGISYIFRVNSQDKKATELERLVEKFLNLSLLDIYNEKSIHTDAHHALLSFLLQSANNPLKSVLTSKSEAAKKAEEASFDWKRYLLSDEDHVDIGVNMSEECKQKLYDSDDEVWDLTNEDLWDDADDLNDNAGVVLPIKKYQWAEEVVEFIERNDEDWIKKHMLPSYWLDDGELDFKIDNDQYAMGYNEICRNWEIFKRSYYYVPHSSYKLLAEKQLVVETLWMLQGLENLYVYKYESGKYIPKEDIVVTHLTRETLSSFLTCFSVVGNKINKLKNYSEKVLNYESSISKSFKAFAYVIGRYLMERSVLLSQIEQTITKKEDTFTLLMLKRWLMDDSPTVSCIYQLYIDAVVVGHKLYSTETERLVYFMDIFYSRICMYDELGDAGLSKILVILPMFLVVCQPYLDNLDSWMTMGELPHIGDEEFMIYKAQDIEKGEANYWSQTFKIKEMKVKGQRSVTLVPTFIQVMQKQILLSGKSLGLLAEFGNYITNLPSTNSIHDEFKKNLKNYLHKSNERILKGKDLDIRDYAVDASFKCVECRVADPLIKENFNLMFYNLYQQIQLERKNGVKAEESNQFEEWTELLKGGSCRPPIKLLIEQCLFPVILKRYDTSCTFLLKFFIEEFNLFSHMQVMWNFFLTEASGAIHAFFSELFDMAKRKVFWQDVAYLNIVLQDALQLYHPDMTESVKVSLQPSELRSNAYLFDGLSLHYKAPWPITTILDVKTEQKYNEIFTFLLRVRRAIWVLEQLRLHELLRPSSGDPLVDAHYSGDDYETPLQVRKLDDIALDSSKQKLKISLHIIRMNMLHIVHNFFFYLMTRIQDATHAEFEPKLKEAKDLDEILELHQTFLDSLRKKCFLHEKIGPPREAIFRILTLVFDFELLWLSGIDIIDAKRLETIERDFDRCKYFLHSFFTSITKRGSCPHYEFLAHTLKA